MFRWIVFLFAENDCQALTQLNELLGESCPDFRRWTVSQLVAIDPGHRGSEECD